MTRLRSGLRHVSGWVHGLVEGAEPDASHPPASAPLGVIDAGENFVATEVGKLEVRGGTRVVQSFTTNGVTPVTAVLAVHPFASFGLVVVAHHTGTSKTYAYLLTPTGAFATGVEATSRVDLGWTAPALPQPIIVELWETVFIVDGTETYANRQPMVALSNLGALVSPTYNLDADGATPASGIKARCAEVHNGVLFVAGYDSEASGVSNSPETVRHSLLGTNPTSATGFDVNGWARVGAVGTPVIAMRSGDDAMLIAKQAELYRLTGFGRALPGWQYTLERLDTTTGVGVAGPRALDYAKGYWYGIGAAGPFRTDGTTVELLTGARRRTWPKVDQLTSAWVAYHPDRNVVLFGIHTSPAGTGRSATYPSRCLLWDVERERWTADWTPSADLSSAMAVPIRTVTTPAAAVSALTYVSGTLTTVAASWALNGDLASDIQLWIRPTSGATVLWSTAPAASTTGTLTALTAATNYKLKARFVRGASVGEFTPEVDAYTAPDAPSLSGFGDPSPSSKVFLQWYNPNAGATIAVRRNGVTLFTLTSQPAGVGTITDPSSTIGVTYNYDVVATMPGWPVAIDHIGSNVVSIKSGG